MLFNSFIFLFYLVFVVVVYYKLPFKFRNLFLLICSYFFYGYWDFRFLALLGFTTIVDYFIALKIDSVSEKSQKKKFLLVSLILNLGILSIFKYLDFFASSFTNFLHFFGLESNWTTINILLPVGISFYTFQSMSYCIDVYRGDLKAEKSFLNFALFVS